MHEGRIQLTSNTNGNGITMSNVSFVVSKVDTPAMIKKNIRIINSGKVDSVGRVEVKFDGRWHTIRVHNDDIQKNADIAKAACRYLGYVYGEPAGVDENITGSPQVSAIEVVQQITLQCDPSSRSFNCFVLDRNPYPDHLFNMKIMCRDEDPSDPNKQNGL